MYDFELAQKKPELNMNEATICSISMDPLLQEEILLVQDYRRLSQEEKESIRLILRNYLRYKGPEGE